MKKSTIAKKTAGFVGNLGASTIVTTICRVAVPPSSPLHLRVMYGLGAFGLAGAAGRVAQKEIETQIDEVSALFKKVENGDTVNVITNLQ